MWPLSNAGLPALRREGAWMTELVRRVSSLTILPDIAPTAAMYSSLGCERVDSGAEGCIGFKAGGTYVILATEALMAADFSPTTAALLTGRTVAYIYVASLKTATAQLPEDAVIIEQIRTSGGTAEAVVDHNGQHMIFAEKL